MTSTSAVAAEQATAAPSTLGALFDWRADLSGDRPFLRMAGCEYTYDAFRRDCNRLANGLAALGLSRGEVVAVMLPNCPEFVLTWFALAKLGAVESAINTAFRGPGLAHMLNVSGGHVFVVDESLLDAVEFVAGDIALEQTLIVRGDAEAASRRFPHWHVIALASVLSEDASPRDAHVDPSETAMLLFTSGTTGESKACILSHRFLVRAATSVADYWSLTPEDVLYCPFPLFHADATYLTTLPAILRGACAAIGARFSVSGFWDEVRRFDATVFDFMGSTLALLWKQPESRRDRDHRVRLAWGIPMPEWGPEFERRFGVTLVDGYGLTEAGVVALRPLDGQVPSRSCGRPVHPYDVQIFDDGDNPCPPGEVGEIVIRPLEPSAIFDGYFGNPAATLEAFRNLWFHTGDLASMDRQGFLYFAGRKKDAIRRRGENISAAEVEAIMTSHPSIAEAAAIGVPSELSEEDIKVCAVRRRGTEVSADELISWCALRMSRFMVPRYIEFVETLPKTPTEKIEKFRLLEHWQTAQTWDRQTEGYLVADSATA